MKTQVVAILETMWNWRDMTAEVPRYFRINPNNHSGRRLYKLVGSDVSLLVTNACRELGTSANDHKTPDPDWLFENLTLLKDSTLILVCGKVAQATYKLCKFVPAVSTVVLEIPHPAARNWSRSKIDETSRMIHDALTKKPPVKEA